MHARVVTATISLDKLDEAIRLWRDAVAPTVRQQKGFKSARLLVQRGTGKVTSIGLWETEADLQRSVEWNQEQLAQFREPVYRPAPRRALRTRRRSVRLENLYGERDPRSIARSLKRSAERSHRRKSDPFRSAMSMLTFYVNRAGRTLSKERRPRLEAAKDELRSLYRKRRRRSD